jgi:hypothetical protein
MAGIRSDAIARTNPAEHFICDLLSSDGLSVETSANTMTGWHSKMEHGVFQVFQAGFREVAGRKNGSAGEADYG